MSMYTYYNTARNMNQSTVPYKKITPQQEMKQEQNMIPMEETNQYQNMTPNQNMNQYQTMDQMPQINQEMNQYQDMYPGQEMNQNMGQYENMYQYENTCPGQCENQYQDMNSSSYVEKCYDLSSRLLKAMTGERDARLYYQELERMAPSTEDKSVINKIYNDEGKHYSNFSKLYTQITGRQPVLPAPTEPNIPDYISGVKKAIFDETDAYEFYRDTTMCTVNSNAKEIFYEAMTDENEHAIRLNYLYTKNK